jgi:hypothetical protein
MGRSNKADHHDYELVHDHGCAVKCHLKFPKREIVSSWWSLMIGVAAGTAGRCQPLNRRTFGVTEELARAQIEECIAFEGDDAIMIHEWVVLLLEVWNQTTQEEALGAWDHFHGVDKLCL